MKIFSVVGFMWCCFVLLAFLGEACDRAEDSTQPKEAIVYRSGPSRDTMELNYLRSMTKEEKAWHMLENLTIDLFHHKKNIE